MLNSQYKAHLVSLANIQWDSSVTPGLVVNMALFTGSINPDLFSLFSLGSKWALGLQRICMFCMHRLQQAGTVVHHFLIQSMNSWIPKGEQERQGVALLCYAGVRPAATRLPILFQEWAGRGEKSTNPSFLMQLCSLGVPSLQGSLRDNAEQVAFNCDSKSHHLALDLLLREHSYMMPLLRQDYRVPHHPLLSTNKMQSHFTSSVTTRLCTLDGTRDWPGCGSWAGNSGGCHSCTPFKWTPRAGAIVAYPMLCCYVSPPDRSIFCPVLLGWLVCFFAFRQYCYTLQHYDFACSKINFYKTSIYHEIPKQPTYCFNLQSTLDFPQQPLFHFKK